MNWTTAELELAQKLGVPVEHLGAVYRMNRRPAPSGSAEQTQSNGERLRRSISEHLRAQALGKPGMGSVVLAFTPAGKPR